MKKILILSGSVRQGNFTQHVADFVFEFVKKQEDLAANIIKASDLDMNFKNEGYEVKIPKLKAAVAEADGLILVAPEYNHGYPASLKYMLDTTTGEYNHKPVALVGVSKGPFGGTRVIENLLPVVRELGLIVASADLQISNVQAEIENGKFKDVEKWEKRAEKMLSELNWLVNKLV